jgi:Domain of unknown function (DUF4276)
MKFVLFVEGHTERSSVPAFLKRWLDAQLNQPVGIHPVLFEGWPELWRDTPNKARMYLFDPRRKDDIVGVVALLDLYGPTFYPPEKTTVSERYDWAKRELEAKVGHSKFRLFFAVHETEAWLLSNRDIFPSEVKRALPARISAPESVNFDEPPAKLLERLYRSKRNRNYKKVTDGKELFGKLDPSFAYAKCRYLKDLLDEMLTLAHEAGL